MRRRAAQGPSRRRKWGCPSSSRRALSDASWRAAWLAGRGRPGPDLFNGGRSGFGVRRDRRLGLRLGRRRAVPGAPARRSGGAGWAAARLASHRRGGCRRSVGGACGSSAGRRRIASAGLRAGSDHRLRSCQRLLKQLGRRRRGLGRGRGLRHGLIAGRLRRSGSIARAAQAPRLRRLRRVRLGGSTGTAEVWSSGGASAAGSASCRSRRASPAARRPPACAAW